MASNGSSPLTCSLLHCADATVSVTVIAAFSVLRLLLLIPLCVFILQLAVRRRRSVQNTSHSDVFALQAAVLELIWVLGAVLLLAGLYSRRLPVLTLGQYLVSVAYNGEMLFHVLTCVERYLAVVHPVTYRGLRSSRGVRVRNASVGCVWLLCVSLSYFTNITDPSLPTSPLFSILVVSLVVVSFCSVSVLRALIGPKPGDGGGDREHVYQSRKRAFFIIVAVLGVLLLWFLGLLVAIFLLKLLKLDHDGACSVQASGFWFNLPSSLVLPLLYLHRAGKIPCFNNNRE